MNLQLKRILVPTDFSAPSEAAIEMAIELARRFGAELTLFHAHEVPAYVFPDGAMPLTPALMQDLEESISKELGRLATRVRTSGLTVHTKTALGTHDHEILRFAAEMNADLIVMGTHGRTGLRHALLGSVAEKVVRRAPCPVLTVRPQALDHLHHPV